MACKQNGGRNKTFCILGTYECFPAFGLTPETLRVEEITQSTQITREMSPCESRHCDNQCRKNGKAEWYGLQAAVNEFRYTAFSSSSEVLEEAAYNIRYIITSYRKVRSACNVRKLYLSSVVIKSNGEGT